MILTAILLIGLFHHKHKPVAQPPVDSAVAQMELEDRKAVKDGIEGAQAFEKDTQFSKFERPELDEFEHQLFICSQDTDPLQLDKDVDILVEDGNALMALDSILHTRNVI